VSPATDRISLDPDITGRIYMYQRLDDHAV
jgi:hypothetical protein